MINKFKFGIGPVFGFYAIILLSAMIPMFGYCQQTTIISGEIRGTKEQKVYLRKDMEVIPAELVGGKFSFPIAIKKESYYEFLCGDFNMEIYLEPGDDLFLSGDDPGFEKSLAFSGNRAAENTFILARDIKRSGIYSPIFAMIRKLPEKEFLLSLDSVIDAMKKDLEEYTAGHPGLSKRFVFYESANLDYIRANQKGIFAGNYASNHKDGSSVSPAFFRYLDELKYNRAELLPAPRFQDFIRNIRYNETDKLLLNHPQLKDSSNGNIRAMFMIIDSLFKDQAIKNYSLYTTLKFELRQHGLAVPKEIIDRFYKECTNKSYLDIIRQSYYVWTTLAKGNKAPDFVINDPGGRKYSLSDFRGKYVYIDVWATWCLPCLEEMPYWEKLTTDLMHSNLVFLKISIDLDKVAWTSKISALKSGAIELRVENGASSAFSKAYAVKDIPRFILLDKNGKIIDANASGPSSEEFRNYLTRLPGIRNQQN